MRKTILTPDKLELVQQLVNDGQSAAEIAETVGCTVGSLRVICCKRGISLRKKKKEFIPKPQPQCQIKVHLTEFIYIHLNNHAAKKGITRGALVSRLLEQIAKDDLYQAVLDE